MQHLSVSLCGQPAFSFLSVILKTDNFIFWLLFICMCCSYELISENSSEYELRSSSATLIVVYVISVCESVQL